MNRNNAFIAEVNIQDAYDIKNLNVDKKFQHMIAPPLVFLTLCCVWHRIKTFRRRFNKKWTKYSKTGNLIALLGNQHADEGQADSQKKSQSVPQMHISHTSLEQQPFKSHSAIHSQSNL